MPLQHNRTYSAKGSQLDPQWQVVDAAGKRLGHVATAAARMLQGKHKPTYSPHLLTGDFVIVVNAAQVSVSGRKSEQKTYYRHSGYPDGLTATSFQVMLEKHPDRVIRAAVKGMLPRNSLARHMLGRLHVYPGPDHPHQAQVNAGRRRTHAAPAEPAPDAPPQDAPAERGNA